MKHCLVAIAVVAGCVDEPQTRETQQALTSNLALGRPAIQSSTFGGAHAGLAVDGNTSGIFADGSVTHTLDSSGGAWWEVDLGENYLVSSITIHNRTELDCAGQPNNDCALRLANFDVQTTENGQFWTSHPHPGAAGATAEIAIGHGARRVRIVLSSANALSLAEVEVFGDGTSVGTPPALDNLALGKPAAQSSTGFGGVPERAVDGNLDGAFANGSVTHTDDTAGWWQVDLGDAYNVDHITIWNRNEFDCPDMPLNDCRSRLADFDVQTSTDGQAWTSHLHPGAAGTTVELALAEAVRYVRIQLHAQHALSLAEVQVWGDGSLATPPPLVNLALGKPATQSSTRHFLFWWWCHDEGPVASNAVDGNPSGNFFDDSVTLTKDGPGGAWWQVDLGEAREVDHVTIWNRTDFICLDMPGLACGKRLRNFEVQTSVDGQAWTVDEHAGTAGATTELGFGGMPVRYVRIYLKSPNPLSLAEVEVWGR